MIRRFTKADYPMLKDWYEARKMKPPSIKLLSDNGFICDERVMGFLYTTNSSLAMVEAVIGDPSAPQHLRSKSLAELCDYLVEAAQQAGYEHIFGVGTNSTISALAKDMGFKEEKLKVWTLSFGHAKTINQISNT